jgi:hypothetical protein
MLLTLDGWMQLLVDRTLGEVLLVLRQRLHSVFAHCVQAPTKQLSPAHADTVRFSVQATIAYTVVHKCCDRATASVLDTLF